jgi:formylglycine-generating enzyme required for sulfatase activity
VPSAIGSPYYRTEVGEHENSASPYGTFDQNGNVAEWTEAIDGKYRDLLGRSFLDGYVYISSGDEELPAGKGRTYGFRVVQTPEPATLSLLALGGLAVLRKRRKQ